MTLKTMDGFETCRQDSDLRTRGYTYWTGVSSVVSPSSTGTGGFGVSQLTPANTDHTDFPFSTSSAPSSFGFCPGLAINSLWTAGGFAFGISARSNLGTGNSLTYGASSQILNDAAIFDGTKYWALQYNGSAYNLATSPDLKTWTVTPSQPPIAMANTTSLAYMGNGVVACCIRAVTTAQNVYYTNNNGASWSTQTLSTQSSGPALGKAFATGNPTYPHGVVFATAINGTACGVYIGTLGGTMTLVNSMATSTLYLPSMRVQIIGGIIFAFNGAGTTATATASNASLNTAGAWTSWGGLNANSSDIAYNPVSNLYVVADPSGIATFPNTGAAGTPVAPTAAVTLTRRYSTVGIQNVFWNGTVMVGIGLSGHVVTSPDGITWTEAGAKILPVGTANYDYLTTIYDGSKYVIFTDATTGCVITTPDGVSNYQCQYTADKVFSAGGTTDANGIVVYPVSAIPAIPLTSAAAYVLGTKAYVLSPQAVSSGSITAYLALEVVGTSISAAKTITVATGVVTRAQATHYYEFVYTKNAGTTNQFTFTLYVDGTLQYTDSAFQFAPTTDTTSMPFFAIPGTQNVSQWDDMYFNVIDGLGLSGALGPVSIVARRPGTDVQDQWVKNGSAASNSLSVAQLAVSSNQTNYLTSSNAGDKDIYTSADTLPVGYAAKAVQVEGYFARTGASAPVVNLGISSGGVESDGTAFTVASATPVFTSTILEKDPNGSKAWTNTTVLATQIVNNHVS